MADTPWFGFERRHYKPFPANGFECGQILPTTPHGLTIRLISNLHGK
ncbi:hypothetical protein NEIELOOT_00113 [Neisseria elongata subsp. glycolytica ATCC 29315]|uniref:Uncharacterized protein n=1 Tax=Neisseria elongata subsp. glycolytica ATCC 29315 TaxID=546263 RepID=D4DM53_NEIEG|nr:hypothetical protein NEIELOOT_00113 [Neisseria elongata subsp. glycolytica ATCC 29315]